MTKSLAIKAFHYPFRSKISKLLRAMLHTRRGLSLVTYNLTIHESKVSKQNASSLIALKLYLRTAKKPWKQLVPRLFLYSIVSISLLRYLLQLIELPYSLLTNLDLQNPSFLDRLCPHAPGYLDPTAHNTDRLLPNLARYRFDTQIVHNLLTNTSPWTSD